MKLTFKTRLSVVSLLCAGSFCAVARDNGTDKAAVDTAQQLRTFFADQDKANRDGLSTTELAKRFYTEDAVVIGEGEAAPKHGIKGAVAALDAWFAYLGPNGNKGCTFSVQDKVVTSGDMASVFAVLSCKPNPPKLEKAETIRQLFVLKRTAQGWRVAHEMWQAGAFGK